MPTVLDDALSEENFSAVKNILEEWNLNWFYSRTVAHHSANDVSHGGYLVHDMYKDNHILSDKLDAVFRSVVDYLPEYRTLLRMRFIMYPRTLEVLEHNPHRDFDFENKAFLLYMNTNNGFTRLKDGTKVNSVENRALLHEGGEEHNSSTCTDAPFRICLAVNYL